jgi:hypothetical protein
MVPAVPVVPALPVELPLPPAPTMPPAPVVPAAPLPPPPLSVESSVPAHADMIAAVKTIDMPESADRPTNVLCGGLFIVG